MVSPKRVFKMNALYNNKEQMNTIEITGKNSTSKILVGESYLNTFKYIKHKNVVIITDKNLYNIYESFFTNRPTIVLETGEEHKTLKTTEIIYNKFLELNVDRSWFVLGFGGGIVCDITGYCATTFMRGLDFGFISSSLLSQVDASTGGKNGVNFGGLKNMVGTFSQPQFVICDVGLLATLPAEEFDNGFAEIIKHAIIASDELFDYLINNRNDIVDLNKEKIKNLVYESVVLKSIIVNNDETEKGERKKLNFGHTIGHAIEVVANISHGKAIAIGMTLALKKSAQMGLISNPQANKAIELIKSYDLPTELKINKQLLAEKIMHDKKSKGNKIDFILIKKIGNAVIHELNIDEIL